jgi:glycosyltransferase involved in cell wall biosynthesis
MKLSILIPTVPQRELLFKELTTYLLWQIGELINKEVELIWDASPVGSMTTGEKRNKLLNEAKGDYVWFIDDDDWISDTAVKDILEGIKTNPDSFAINGTFTENGGKYRQWFISKDLEYCADYSTGVEVYHRPPNHITPMKRSIALQIGFPAKSNQEDYDFCMRLKDSRLIQSEYKIDKPIYEYRYINYNKLY